MSFLKRLFGGGSKGETEAAPAAPAAGEAYRGFTLAATPIAEGGQFRLSGRISKEFDGQLREHGFVRADLFPDRTEAAQAALRKGRQIVDEQGDRLFDS